MITSPIRLTLSSSSCSGSGPAAHSSVLLSDRHFRKLLQKGNPESDWINIYLSFKLALIEKASHVALLLTIFKRLPNENYFQIDVIAYLTLLCHWLLVRYRKGPQGAPPAPAHSSQIE